MYVSVFVETVINYFNRGEYFCPFCRHLSNSVLPIFDDSPRGIDSKTHPEPCGDFVAEIDNDLRQVTIEVSRSDSLLEIFAFVLFKT